MKQLRGHHHNQSSAAGTQMLAQNTTLLDALGKTGPSLNASPAVTGSTGSIINLLA